MKQVVKDHIIGESKPELTLNSGRSKKKKRGDRLYVGMLCLLGRPTLVRKAYVGRP